MDPGLGPIDPRLDPPLNGSQSRHYHRSHNPLQPVTPALARILVEAWRPHRPPLTVTPVERGPGAR
jgi:hypothetical protein